MIITINLFNRFKTFTIEVDPTLKFETEQVRLDYIYSLLNPLVWDSLSGMEKQTYGKSIDRLPNFPIISLYEASKLIVLPPLLYECDQFYITQAFNEFEELEYKTYRKEGNLLLGTAWNSTSSINTLISALKQKKISKDKITDTDKIKKYIRSLNKEDFDPSTKSINGYLDEMSIYDLEILTAIFLRNFKDFSGSSISNMLVLLKATDDYQYLYDYTEELSCIFNTEHWDEALQLVEGMLLSKPDMNKYFLLSAKKYNESCKDYALDIFKDYSDRG